MYLTLNEEYTFINIFISLLMKSSFLIVLILTLNSSHNSPLEIWHELYCHNFENYSENCERGDTYDLLHSHDYAMQIKLFLDPYRSTLSSFHFKNSTRFFINYTFQVTLASFSCPLISIDHDGAFLLCHGQY